MALVLPEHHRWRGALEASGVAVLDPDTAATGALPVRRVGVINLMPTAEAYEDLLLHALGAGAARAGAVVAPVFVRLASHRYASSDAAYLERAYVLPERAVAEPLDGLVLTGAPVEELAFHDVRYWDELVALLGWARANVASTLGLCWGAMALAKLLGIEKRALPKKLFGSFELEALVPSHPLLRSDAPLVCAQSRHAGTSDVELERAARDGSVRLIARGREGGYAIFESADRRFVMHQGHPEYSAERLVFEYARDRALGRADVEAPVGLDLARPAASFRSHGADFFAGFLGGLSGPTPADPDR